MSRILIVDNDRDMCGIITDVLREMNHGTNIAYDGMTALEKIRKTRYDLVILDYKLPDISGLKVLDEARLLSPGLQVVMISAYGDRFVKSRAKELGAFAFLDKPFDVKRLARVVKSFLATNVQTSFFFK
jgi:DNA-binding response OmpR family regulator